MKLTEADINPDRKLLLWNIYAKQLKEILEALYGPIMDRYEVVDDNLLDEDKETFKQLKIIYQEVILTYIGGVTDGLNYLKNDREHLVTLYERIITEEYVCYEQDDRCNDCPRDYPNKQCPDYPGYKE